MNDTFRCGHDRTPENTVRKKSAGREYDTCRQCQITSVKKWNQAHPERLRTYGKNYYHRRKQQAS